MDFIHNKTFFLSRHPETIQTNFITIHSVKQANRFSPTTKVQSIYAKPFLPTVNQTAKIIISSTRRMHLTTIIVDGLFVNFLGVFPVIAYKWIFIFNSYNSNSPALQKWRRVEQKKKTKRYYLIGANMAAVVRLVSNRVYIFYIIFFFFHAFTVESADTHTWM